MRTRKQGLVAHKRAEAVDEYAASLDTEAFSLVSLVDELLPQLAFESNLRFGNFHAVKMSTFLRRLARQGVFSSDTQRAVGALILKELIHRDWVSVQADIGVHAANSTHSPADQCYRALQAGNVHNAYFYAAIALQDEPAALGETLLWIGAASIPDSLGHSISCFYPVMEDIIYTDHPAGATALLSLICYLGRFRTAKAAKGREPASREELLTRCTTGTTIVDIHQMITFYIYCCWDDSPWRGSEPLPWGILETWTEEKDINRTTIAPDRQPPADYTSFAALMGTKDSDVVAPAVLGLVDRDWHRACDWLFRSYADFYTAGWDPHYYTGLYAALQLYRLSDELSLASRQQALVQALRYFLEDQ